MLKRRSKRLRSMGLAEQVLSLSDPKPISFHPDEDFLNETTAAKVCDFTYEEESDSVDAKTWTKARIRARKADLDDDPRYVGKVVSRKVLEAGIKGSGSESEMSDSDKTKDLIAGVLDDALEVGQFTDDINTDDEGNIISDQPDAEEKGGVATLSMTSLKENIEKGKAVKNQIRLLDGLLETRIKLQDVLSLTNQLPPPKRLPLFVEEGGPPVQEALHKTQKNLKGLLDDLIDLQTILLSKNNLISESKNLIQGGDEEISSDLEVDTESEEDVPGDLEGDPMDSSVSEEDVPGDLENGSRSHVKGKRKKRETSDRKDYGQELERLHLVIKPYRDAIISKWNEKTRLASGKITSKAFLEVDRSILSQIEHVLKDKERLRRRTQLKRSVYCILGEGDDEETQQEGDLSESRRDSHLKDYNQHIFDDTDFYHQLLRELVERKTNFTESSDLTEIGRKWLELQKLQNKAKKKVDTKASKGRKIRYNIHPKLVNFMAPVERGDFSEASKNNLFSSLFGSRTA